jgi:2-amino-4-hydroxy-6-hydroxymethyldihydropteridine diphosphokinase
MEFCEWEPVYKSILTEFGYSREEDEKAARLLRSLAKSSGIEILEDKIRGRKVTICGAAEILSDEIKSVKNSSVIIAADETTSVLLESMVPDIIVTDLDGNVDDQIEANERGSVAVIHAHGDNIPAIKKYAPLFRGKIILTTQSESFDDVHNFGGFTDGDRAFLMAKHFGAREIKLMGFDFENPREKEGKDIEIKRRKLRWAKRLIEQETKTEK